MCGISGIINKNISKVDRKEIQKINDLIAHRGPDSEGFYFEKNFAFGHRRLSILDLSIDGHQPMHYLDKYTITYNGEVYNYLEIRENGDKSEKLLEAIENQDEKLEYYITERSIRDKIKMMKEFISECNYKYLFFA